MKRLLWGLSFLYIFTSLFLLGFLWVQKEESRDTYNSNLQKQYISIFESIKSANEKRSRYIYDTQIATPEILNLFKNFYTKSDQEKDIVREKLHTKLDSLYKTMQKYNYNQLHFHLKDNTSFLRMHRPEKYGDDLTNVRLTIAYVNKHHESMAGFEEGRIFNSWKHVYPLTIDGEHMGSVELSVSVLDIMKEIKRHDVKHIEFIIDKNVVQEKVFDSEKSNYIQSPYKDYLYDKGILAVFPVTDDCNAFGFEKNLVHLHTSNQDIVRFPIALTNPISNKDVAYLILTVKDDFILEKNNIFNLLASLILLSIVFMIIFIIRRIRMEKTLKEQEIKLQKIAHEKEKEEKIAQAKDSFLLLFSHELKTPLNAIINFTKYLRKNQDNLEKLPKNKIAKLLGGIEESADLMLKNVMQILDFNKLKKEKLVLNLTNVVVYELLEDIIAQNKPLKEQHNIDIEFISEYTDKTINTDKNRLEQIISNILSSAIKFAQKKVLISFTCKEDSWKLLIEYDGNEMKNKDEVLELFSNNDEQLLHNEQNGIGIGLNYAKLLCDGLKISCIVEDSKNLNGISFKLTKLI